MPSQEPASKTPWRDAKWIVRDTNGVPCGRIRRCVEKEARALLDQITPGLKLRHYPSAPKALRVQVRNTPWMTPFQFAALGVHLPPEFPRAARLRVWHEGILHGKAMAAKAGAR